MINAKITWLGQGGFLLEINGKRLLIDPFLSNIVEERQGLKRLVEPPLSIDDLCPDYIFITHNHLDHFDPIALPEIHRRYPKALIVGPESVMLKAKEHSFDPWVLISLNKNESICFDQIKITATPAYHSDLFAVGCLIEIDDFVVYLSADTVYTDTLSAEINSLTNNKIAVAIVCINGKLGNMSWEDALKLVVELQPTLAIPTHYGMFAENTVDPSMFLEGCEEKNLQPLELHHGIQVEI